jgi:hypothetical protein
MFSSFPPLPDEPPANPYAAPVAAIGAAGPDLEFIDSEAEAIRRTHIGHEAAIKSIGLLHYLAAFFSLIVVLSTLAILLSGARGPADLPARMGVVVLFVIYLIAGILNLALGIGMRGLHAWARWTETALASISLLFVLLGALGVALLGTLPRAVLIVYAVTGLIQGYILYLLLAPKGSMVFSPEYKAIIAKTPHIKYKTSTLAKVALAIFLALVVVIVVAAIAGR